jgi:inner membrane protein
MSSPAPPSRFTLGRRSNIVRILMLGILVILFQIPILSLDGLIRERQTRRDTAVAEVASKWGRQQSVVGPMLVVPYLVTIGETVGGKTVTRQERHLVTFLPERLSTRSTLAAERRQRGIFSTSVYRADLHVEGVFARPEMGPWAPDPAGILWDRAQLLVGISDTRAMESTAAMTWNAAPAEVLPGVTESAIVESGVHAETPIPPGAKSIPFSIDLPLKGSAGAYWGPFGKTTEVQVSSNWPNPSFQGNWLPERRGVSAKGFQAEWKIAYLGRNFPQSWRDDAVQKAVIDSARFGFDLIETTDQYQMAARSVKYAGLFLLLVFATLWLVEVLAKMSVHPIQYVLVGCAMCVFYLLELSLSEHIGFGAAYGVATLAIVAQVAGYCAAVLKTWGRAAIVGSVTALLFGYLFVVLTNEDYALLIGSIGVFLILATIMFLTRRIDWWGAPEEAPSA